MANNGLSYRHDGHIANQIREGILNGLSLTRIHDSIRHYQQCPASWTTLSKIYREDIAQARAEIDKRVTGFAFKRMEEGSDKLIELYLRSKVGWNPTVNINEMDNTDPDEAVDAVDVLMEKLGKKQKDDPVEES